MVAPTSNSSLFTNSSWFPCQRSKWLWGTWLYSQPWSWSVDWTRSGQVTYAEPIRMNLTAFASYGGKTIVSLLCWVWLRKYAVLGLAAILDPNTIWSWPSRWQSRKMGKKSQSQGYCWATGSWFTWNQDLHLEFLVTWGSEFSSLFKPIWIPIFVPWNWNYPDIRCQWKYVAWPREEELVQMTAGLSTLSFVEEAIFPKLALKYPWARQG